MQWRIQSKWALFSIPEPRPAIRSSSSMRPCRSERVVLFMADWIENASCFRPWQMERSEVPMLMKAGITDISWHVPWLRWMLWVLWIVLVLFWHVTACEVPVVAKQCHHWSSLVGRRSINPSFSDCAKDLQAKFWSRTWNFEFRTDDN